jgi:hypothetical protein
MSPSALLASLRYWHRFVKAIVSFDAGCEGRCEGRWEAFDAISHRTVLLEIFDAFCT